MCVLLIMSSAYLSGCASSPSETAPPVVSEQEAAIPVEVAVVEDDYDGDGLELTLDGSSMEAWDASMARIKRHTDEASYKSLEAAVGYLMVYDLASRRDKEKLIKNLDGMTGYEVLAKVGWRKPPPGKSQVEEGSADAKIIDT